MNRKKNQDGAEISGDFVSDRPDVTPGGAAGTPPPAADHQDRAKALEDDAQEETPPWAAPLRDMYQQVVDEPLPDFLSDLISRLDRDAE